VGPLSPVLGPVKWRVLPLPPVDWAPMSGAGRGVGHAFGWQETCAPLLLAFPGGLA
jgi:hypothetical protein